MNSKVAFCGLVAALIVCGSAQTPAKAAGDCTLKDGGRSCTEHDALVVSLRSKANEAAARINRDRQAQTALHAALARHDTAGAARILAQNGLPEAGQVRLVYDTNSVKSHAPTADVCHWVYSLHLIVKWKTGIDFEVREELEC